MGRKTTEEAAETLMRVFCTVKGVRTALPDRTASFELGSVPIWTLRGPLGPRPLPSRALDLLDIIGAVYRAESGIRKRSTDPAIRWSISAPVRDLAFWRDVGGDLLASLLGFMNRADWDFSFSHRKDAPALDVEFSDESPVNDVVLFSGGLDSLCGAGAGDHDPSGTRLVSHYHGQAKLQAYLAERLGFREPAQWRLSGRRGREGMNLLRSAMFLTLAATVAYTYGAKRLFQYENGVLALAVPQSGNFVPTRHAHPETHRRIKALFDAVYDNDFVILNPFLGKTKREVVEAFAKVRGVRFSRELMRLTESCWNISQPKVSGQEKGINQHCGVCTPCIVRATALPREIVGLEWGNENSGGKGYAYNLRKQSTRDDYNLGMTFRAYLEFVDIVVNASSPSSMIDELSPEATEIVDDISGPSQEFVADVMQRFVNEFCETFKVAAS